MNKDKLLKKLQRHILKQLMTGEITRNEQTQILVSWMCSIQNSLVILNNNLSEINKKLKDVNKRKR